jgi:hypothetical protein
MSNYIRPIDPLVQENHAFFHADEKMHYILENKDLQTYFDYVKNKYNSIKPEEVQPEKISEEPTQEYKYDRNKYKKQMLDNIWTNIVNLENTLNKFKNIK